MDLHIYDMKLNPGDAVILTGHVEPDEVESFSGYLKIAKEIFPNNPVIFVPDDATIDAMTEKEIVLLLRDAMTPDALSKMCDYYCAALSIYEEDNIDEV